MPLRLFAVVLFFLAQISPLTAAEFTFIDGRADPPVNGNWVREHCNMRMTGEVATGDTERFEALLAKHANQVAGDPELLGNPRIVTLCLDSPGGSLAEAIKLAEAIRKPRPFPRGTGIPFVATRLEAGARCESACAIVFMSGTIDGWEDPPYPSRSIHPTARLGFHAPALAIGGGNYTERHVNTAFDISLQSISSILRVLHVGEAPDGTPYGGTDRWIEASLLEAMLRTPASSMRYIETVDDAGRWTIPVSPLPSEGFDYLSAWRACLNRLAWNTHRPSKMFKTTPDAYSVSEAPKRNGELRRLIVIVDEMSGQMCEVTLYVGGFLSVNTDPTLEYSDEYKTLTESGKARKDNMISGYASLWVQLPQTTLASLAPDSTPQPSAAASAAPISPDRLAPRFGGERVMLMDHNGSQMAWEAKGDRIWIWYYTPRAGLKGSGVVPGTLLFEGENTNGQIRGTARRFSKKCGDKTYAVQQRPASSGIVLEGQYQGRDSNCQSTFKWVPDTLVFEFVEAAIPTATAAPDTPTPTPSPTTPSTAGSALSGRVKVTGVSTGLILRQGPSGQSAELGEVPAGTTNLSLLSCEPSIDAAAWASASAARKRVLLAGSWCSLTYGGQTGFVSGRFLAPQ